MSKKKKVKDTGWTLTVYKDGKAEKFEIDPKMRQQLLSAIEDYDELMTLREHDSYFERNVLVDHICMIFEYNLKKKDGQQNR